MELQEKFKKGEASHTYQRIDSDFSVNIFLGYNDDGNMSMVLTESGKAERVKSSKMIDVNLRRRDDGKLALSFDLLDKSFSSMFLVFCKDMILVCEKAGKELAVSNALIRWKYWKEMFGRRKSVLLDKNEVKGLVGELIELKRYFIPKYGVQNAIKSWMGPLLGHKDFEISNTWYEIKAINDSATQIIISSLEQLDSDYDGYLSIVKLADSSPVAVNAFNLNELVVRVMDDITDPDDMTAFRIKLDNVGYEVNEVYDNYNFIYKGTNIYNVDNSFPRITRKDVSKSIGNVKYTLMLDGLSDFKEE